MSAISPQDYRDQEDGRALRELRAALVATSNVEVHFRSTRSDREWPLFITGGHIRGLHYGRTIAEAADKCRRALR